jgi:hypothetical protein
MKPLLLEFGEVAPLAGKTFLTSLLFRLFQNDECEKLKTNI